ncbi:MAG: Undecaprenyl-diphosphatase [Verrucomicrobiales bacterium]|nr:Undecaprenyl-diphosphatase [Verrucomicrobiales bacterium]
MSPWLIALLLGVIEGITEFIPVSSTGHLLISEHWIPRQSDLFNIVIQCGAVVAVIPLFKERFRKIIFNWREPATRDFIVKSFVAFALTCAGGYVLDKGHFKLPESVRPVAIALIIGGVLFVVVEAFLKNKPASDSITWTVAIAVGLAQLVAAVFPGTSRSGATILIALVLGLSRPFATEFSFIVGIPTMLAAGALKIFKALHHADPTAAPENWSMLAMTTIIAAIVSFIAVKWLLRFIQTHSFAGFGWYRIIFGVVILLAFGNEVSKTPPITLPASAVHQAAR